ncbi:hypothetical protein OSI32_25200, partial [Mycobacterium ulcerans]
MAAGAIETQQTGVAARPGGSAGTATAAIAADVVAELAGLSITSRTSGAAVATDTRVPEPPGGSAGPAVATAAAVPALLI